MIPWRASDVFAAFAAAMVSVWAATGAVIRAQVPVGAAVAWLGAVGVAVFGATLGVALMVTLYGNRVRRAVRSGNREAFRLCAEYLRRGGRRADGALFSDDPGAAALEELKDDLAWAGVRATAAEIRQYLLLSRWAVAGRGRVTVRMSGPGSGHTWRASRVTSAAASF